MRAISRSVLPVVAAVGGLLGWTVAARGQSPKPNPVSEGTRNGQWPSYTGDVRGSRYSPLDQIDASNFNDLEVAWRFKTDSLGTRPEYKLEGTPLMVNHVLYTTAGTRRSVVALDPGTGELLWVHGEHEGARAANAPRQLSGRVPRLSVLNRHATSRSLKLPASIWSSGEYRLPRTSPV